MIDTATVLADMRRELRETVLPAVDDEYARSVVVAIIGILGELPPAPPRDDALRHDLLAAADYVLTHARDEEDLLNRVRRALAADLNRQQGE